jgi:MFS family permease
LPGGFGQAHQPVESKHIGQGSMDNPIARSAKCRGIAHVLLPPSFRIDWFELGWSCAVSRKHSYRTKDVWAISLSAFFADLGYQAVLAGFPLFLVIVLHQPVWEYGIASALSYGGGAVMSYIGARLGDRFRHRRIALIGNSIIPLLSLSALFANPIWAVGLLVGGWWARNLRSPSRRVMLVEAVPDQKQRSAAFGFLHALDVGGGALAAVYVLIALAFHLSFKWIFIGTAVPLLVSTFSLTRSSVDPATVTSEQRQRAMAEQPQPPAFRTLLTAAALYGFTFYSVGFPVLTAAQGGHGDAYGILAFLILQAVSAATGYLLGPKFPDKAAGQFANLAVFGYLLAGIGAAALGVVYEEHLGLAGILIAVAVIGFSLGVIETLEPSATSFLRSGAQSGSGFGSLGAARSIGTFAGNLIMGFLYQVGVLAAYGYAATLSLVAGALVLKAVPALQRFEQKN